MHWSPAIGAEHAACREAAALFDETSFAKIEVSGPGAAELLERLCDNRVAREVGRITYTQMLNSRGGIECDFTVSRLAEDRFGIVTGTAFGRHDLAWIRAHAGDGVRVEDVTSRWACAGLWGPRARDVLAAACTDDLSFPLHALARADGRRRAGARAAGHLRRRARLGAVLPDGVRRRAVAHAVGGRASRTGWSPAATARSTRCGWRRATACGAPTSRPTTRRTRAASASACAPTRTSSAARRSTRRPRGGCAAWCSPTRASVALANEPVRVGGEIAGRVTSGGYGYTVERSIAYAYLPAEHAEPGTEVAVEIFGEWVDGEVAAEPLLDPEGAARPLVTS